jgi:adenine-specific DNA-methyltransferase
MRYFGSKASTIHALEQLIVDKVPTGTLCDCFGGIGTVGAHFKALGYQVTTGDILTFAHHFQVARIKCDRALRFNRIYDSLGIDRTTSLNDIMNNLKPTDGWFVEQYAARRMFFTIENAKKIQACYNQFIEWNREHMLTQREHAVISASLINSMDKVANTAGTYYAYLKHWHRKSLISFKFELIQPTTGSSGCESFLMDAAELVALKKFDVLYLDPPYNTRNYSGYYHLPETIAHGDIPEVHGKSGIAQRTSFKSNFAIKAQAENAIINLLNKAQFRLLVFHYTEDGLIQLPDLKRILKKYGKVEERSIVSRGYTTASSPRSTTHKIYLVANA